jgi:excisionase family DNA binding protein
MYSTEEVADMLGLHVRTVRGYVRDGLLPAVRIAKQYRIAHDDLATFTSGATARPAGVPAVPPRVEVSAIVQVSPIGPEEMTRLTTLVTGATAAGHDPDRQLHVQVIYDQDQASLKIVVIGTADQAAKVLTLISTLTEELPDNVTRA